MNEIRTLMEKFWICRDSDKETFYKVKRDIPNFQRFIREQLGWKLIHTEKLLKLEKRPAHADGVFLPLIEHNHYVKKGDLIGEVVDPFEGTVKQQIRTAKGGLLFTLRAYPVVYEGDLLARILTE